jgi:site-specific recombinase XerD
MIRLMTLPVPITPPNLAVRSHLEASLAALAATSPAARYVRSLTTSAARRSMASAISLAAELLTPDGLIPASRGRGRGGNGGERFARACAVPWHMLNTARLGELRSLLLERGLAPASVNRTLAAIKGVLNQCWLDGTLNADDLMRAKQTLKSVQGKTLPAGRMISRAEMGRLFDHCSSKGVAGARNAACLALMATGLRRREVAAVQMEHYEQSTGRLVVQGKGHRQRAVFLTGGAKAAMDDFLVLRGTDAGALLVACDRSGRMLKQGISEQAVYAILRKVAAEAKVKATPHDFRRSLISELLAAGADLVSVSNVAGHSNPQVTKRYDRRSEDAIRKTLSLVSVPYERLTSRAS